MKPHLKKIGPLWMCSAPDTVPAFDFNPFSAYITWRAMRAEEKAFQSMRSGPTLLKSALDWWRKTRGMYAKEH